MTDDRVHRAFRIAYDGTAYHGYQRQPGVPTVEDAILDAFDELDVDPLTAGYAAAGRTDAGVSAVAQTIALSVPHWLGPRALSGRLPDDVRAWASADVDPTFHPRYDASVRCYTYFLPVDDFDLERARHAANTIVGVHDFSDLSAATDRTTRELSHLELHHDGDCIRITARAPAFVHQQVRRIASLLDLVGTGERSLTDVDRLIDPDTTVQGPDGIPPAPPGPLALTTVKYDDVTFARVTDAVEDAASRFYHRAIQLRGRAAAMGHLADRIRSPADQHP